MHGEVSKILLFEMVFFKACPTVCLLNLLDFFTILY